MKRRVLLGTLAGGLIAPPVPVWAQPPGRVHRLGMLTLTGVPLPRSSSGGRVITAVSMALGGAVRARARADAAPWGSGDAGGLRVAQQISLR